LETNKNIHLSLADIPLANGILRVDKNTSTEAIQLHLGHYALPKVHGNIKKETRKIKGYDVEIVDNGTYQLAMVTISGWDGIGTVNTNGLHPVSNESVVINVSHTFLPGQKDQGFYVTLMLWKKAGEKWTDDELVPVKKIKYADKDKSVIVSFTNGDEKIIQFD
jgi:hypothetical protein